jgi:hypothetical protein
MKRRSQFISRDRSAKIRRTLPVEPTETITTLPVEMQYHIASFLPQSDLRSLMQTSANFRSMSERIIRTAPKGFLSENTDRALAEIDLTSVRFMDIGKLVSYFLPYFRVPKKCNDGNFAAIPNASYIPLAQCLDFKDFRVSSGQMQQGSDDTYEMSINFSTLIGVQDWKVQIKDASMVVRQASMYLGGPDFAIISFILPDDEEVFFDRTKDFKAFFRHDMWGVPDDDEYEGLLNGNGTANMCALGLLQGLLKHTAGQKVPDAMIPPVTMFKFLRVPPEVASLKKKYRKLFNGDMLPEGAVLGYIDWTPVNAKPMTTVFGPDATPDMLPDLLSTIGMLSLALKALAKAVTFRMDHCNTHRVWVVEYPTRQTHFGFSSRFVPVFNRLQWCSMQIGTTHILEAPEDLQLNAGMAMVRFFAWMDIDDELMSNNPVLTDLIDTISNFLRINTHPSSIQPLSSDEIFDYVAYKMQRAMDANIQANERFEADNPNPELMDEEESESETMDEEAESETD